MAAVRQREAVDRRIAEVAGGVDARDRVGARERDPDVAVAVGRGVDRRGRAAEAQRLLLDAAVERDHRVGLVARVEVAEPHRERVGGRRDREGARRARLERRRATLQRRLAPVEFAPVPRAEDPVALVQVEAGERVREAVAVDDLHGQRAACVEAHVVSGQVGLVVLQDDGGVGARVGDDARGQLGARPHRAGEAAQLRAGVVRGGEEARVALCGQRVERGPDLLLGRRVGETRDGGALVGGDRGAARVRRGHERRRGLVPGAQGRVEDRADQPRRRHVDGDLLQRRARRLGHVADAAAVREAVALVRAEAQVGVDAKRLQRRVLPADRRAVLAQQRRRVQLAAERAAELGDAVADLERPVGIGELEQPRVAGHVLAPAHLRDVDGAARGNGLDLRRRVPVEQRDAAVGPLGDRVALEDVDRAPPCVLGLRRRGRAGHRVERGREIVLGRARRPQRRGGGRFCRIAVTRVERRGEEAVAEHVGCALDVAEARVGVGAGSGVGHGCAADRRQRLGARGGEEENDAQRGEGDEPARRGRDLHP